MIYAHIMAMFREEVYGDDDDDDDDKDHKEKVEYTITKGIIMN